MSDFWDLMDCQAPLSMGFSRQQYWSELPFPPPGDLSQPEMEAGCPAFCRQSPALQLDSLQTELPEKSLARLYHPAISSNTCLGVAVEVFVDMVNVYNQ